jgi:hypothetical protein
MHQLCAAVLIAAILVPVIRADGMTHAGACRDWPMPKLPDDRRGAERVPAGTAAVARRVRTDRAQFRRSTRGRQPMPFARP